MKPSILIVYTGGTIGMVQDVISGLLKPFDVKNVLEQIPKLRNIEATIDAVSTRNPKDSANMHPNDWQEIGQLIFDNYNDYSGFVVLHGTDTMAHTTSALSFMFKNLGKPIIFTGSQLPIGHIRTDALENVLTAIEIALLQDGEGSLIEEVCLYFGNTLFRGNCVTKISSQDFNAYASPNVKPLVVSNIKLDVNYKLLRKSKKGAVSFSSKMDDSVFVYTIHPGINRMQFRQICESLDFKVLILETYGSGTIFDDEWLIDSLKKLVDQNVKVINVSQCVYGNVEEMYQVSEVLYDLGVINGKTITLESSITKSMYLLGQKISNDEFNNAFIANLAGELR